ncbi:MAG: dihydrofolate reductase [Gammaproteobacteria bacterium]|nr:dihydrofolate reductase [Gammaproteobacteria bacterium]
MTLSLIVAMAKNRVIGRDNALPWHLSADLKRFRRITMGRPVVMGRKTFESIGRPLDGRQNVVITRNPQFRPEGVTVAGSVDEALSKAEGDEVMVIGGQTIYEQVLPRADRIHLTLIDRAFEGDAEFPAIDEDEWREVEREDVAPGRDAEFGYSFVTLERVTSNK